MICLWDRLPDEIQDKIKMYAIQDIHFNLEVFFAEINIKGSYTKRLPVKKTSHLWTKRSTPYGSYKEYIWQRGNHDMFDHMRYYVRYDGKIVIVTSPYCGRDTDLQMFEQLEFKQYHLPLYNTMAVSFYQII